ncbi:unnamed protein product [Staurois parvus]|uniref:Uncharacterized protein n=1 Tax=Staurois parvus TaxID=386267 RepID=A0ABN9B2J5_9NEOB|nr:unnamed protein product [Staurois parvus]
MGPPSDLGPSGSARVSKWSVRPVSSIPFLYAKVRSFIQLKTHLKHTYIWTS